MDYLLILDNKRLIMENNKNENIEMNEIIEIPSENPQI